MSRTIIENRKEPRFLTTTIGFVFLTFSLFLLPYLFGVISNLELDAIAIAFFSIWFFGWVLGMLCFVFIILFEYYGIEQVIVTKGILEVNKTVFGYGIKKKYQIDFITHMKLNPFFDLSLRKERKQIKDYGRRGGKIEFHYKQKLKSLGHLISEFESNEILESLKANENFNNKNFAQQRV